jgi:hypothetical protein
MYCTVQGTYSRQRKGTDILLVDAKSFVQLIVPNIDTKSIEIIIDTVGTVHSGTSGEQAQYHAERKGNVSAFNNPGISR